MASDKTGEKRGERKLRIPCFFARRFSRYAPINLTPGRGNDKSNSKVSILLLTRRKNVFSSNRLRESQLMVSIHLRLCKHSSICQLLQDSRTFLFLFSIATTALSFFSYSPVPLHFQILDASIEQTKSYRLDCV